MERRLRDRGRGQRPPAVGERPAALRRRHGHDDQGRRSEHLVSLGTIGTGQCGAIGAEYQYVHGSPAIDMCEFHDYDHATQPLPGDQWNGFAVRVSQCNALGKPMLIGESGVVADAATNGGSSGSITATTLLRRRLRLGQARRRVRQRRRRLPVVGEDLRRVELVVQPRQRPVRNRPERPAQRGDPREGDPAGRHTTTAPTTASATTTAPGADHSRRLRERHLQSWEVAWGTLALASSTEQRFAGTCSLKLSRQAVAGPPRGCARRPARASAHRSPSASTAPPRRSRASA